jgi:hypothetical protein
VHAPASKPECDLLATECLPLLRGRRRVRLHPGCEAFGVIVGAYYYSSSVASISCLLIEMGGSVSGVLAAIVRESSPASNAR